MLQCATIVEATVAMSVEELDRVRDVGYCLLDPPPDGDAADVDNWVHLFQVNMRAVRVNRQRTADEATDRVPLVGIVVWDNGFVERRGLSRDDVAASSAALVLGAAEAAGL